jgi:deoxyribonuclease V
MAISVPIRSKKRYMLTADAAIAIQEKLRQQVIITDLLPDPIKIIAGTDVEYDKDTELIAGSIVLLNYETLEVIAVSSHCMEVTFPYIPGLFSFREMPPLLRAYEKLTIQPDLVICDGQGLAHQRKFGLACHFGVTIGKPTIGCGKTRLCGEYHDLAAERGSIAALYADDDHAHIGNALRTQAGINPVFVSTGHKISLPTATDIVLKMCAHYRLPETTRIADHCARLTLLEYKAQLIK